MYVSFTKSAEPLNTPLKRPARLGRVEIVAKGYTASVNVIIDTSFHQVRFDAMSECSSDGSPCHNTNAVLAKAMAVVKKETGLKLGKATYFGTFTSNKGSMCSVSRDSLASYLQALKQQSGEV